MPQPDIEAAPPIRNDYSPFGIPIKPRPVNVDEYDTTYSLDFAGYMQIMWKTGTDGDSHQGAIFCVPPILGPLLFDNTDSDARDHCANERTFLSYLRLSIYMTIVSVAIVMSFHLKSQPSPLELRMARPLGIIFWVLSVACLALGAGNYVKTVNKYSRRAAIVQTGWKTQSLLTIIAFSIVAVCVLFLATNSKRA